MSEDKSTRCEDPEILHKVIGLMTHEIERVIYVIKEMEEDPSNKEVVERLRKHAIYPSLEELNKTRELIGTLSQYRGDHT